MKYNTVVSDMQIRQLHGKIFLFHVLQNLVWSILLWKSKNSSRQLSNVATNDLY